ncbi:hypothetical protein CPAR01_02107 [Colletotrichum paranaense]|uniref:CENP-V/GFA domain-containing protein n=5 Tax=Colletotrichum acutatum species complex TaxID=2707335 RepID=A0AAJ0E566_9PEZI|nr:uncharacterized protein CCOS01_03403 [Colletotrichum costaricense]XP_060353723.1 uncharacterized protein CPAR01_02107 [Colletotrichum paranaense]XP_060382155.1 uncharacterized protein CTAM01_06999 [Colletotrichum tamarilloi]KAI3532276.1 hypothetical protein CSPX01_13588 [Colletotrichum filicis]KAK1468158.1 hypothetical protein CCUS01_06660 [Colletotrichum cuscutae]KAK1499078.1 hypothetical protein CTAM01_06999 [Colletotrichum tamarilloi]KAK1534651.1 hypothetical protein CCOS01_03403 [Colle
MAPYQGHCNCGSVKVTVNKKPDNIVICHCSNCKRAGGPFSMNLFVDDGEWEIDDSQNTLKEYQDSNTDSGNTIQRCFCGKCGSPVKTTTKAIPGKALIKASLFDDIPTEKREVYGQKAINWA